MMVNTSIFGLEDAALNAAGPLSFPLHLLFPITVCSRAARTVSRIVSCETFRSRVHDLTQLL